MRRRLDIALHAVSVRRGAVWALKDVSLTLRAGERWALIGGNGAGKTQLLKLIGTEVWPTPTGRERLLYRVGRRTVDVIEAKQRIAYVGAELQDKYVRYDWNLTLRDLVLTGLHRTELLQQPGTATERRRVAALLERCELAPLADRRFLSLSYGQKRLALLARALIRKPDWLLLDEFYNGLDADYRLRMDALLARARRAGQSWVVAAHRAMDVPRGTQHLLELRAGSVDSIARLRPVDRRRLATQAEEQEHRPPRRRAAKVSVGSGERLLRITKGDLYVDYRRVLRDIDWTLRVGEHWAVFGANGAGKSSFLRMLYGDLWPALGGRIERAGLARGMSIESWKRRTGFVSPELQTEHAVNITVLELVASGRHASVGLSAAPTAADRHAALHWLEFFSLMSVAERQPRQLSYGQLRRALFARALAGEPRLLLLDEPLTGLDPRQRAAMKRLLRRLMTRLTLVIAVHHPEDLPPGITHALYLHKQRATATNYDSAT